MNIKTLQEKTIPIPIYSILQDGKFVLTLDFFRFHRLHKGYEYANLQDLTKGEKCPDKPRIWYINLETGENKPVLKYYGFYTV